MFGSMFAKNVRVDCNAYGDVDVFRIGRHRCTRIHQIMLPRLIVCSVGFSLLLDLSPAHFHPGPKATAGSPVAWATRCPPSGWAFRVSLVRLHRVQVGDIGPLPSRSTVVHSLMRSLRVVFCSNAANFIMFGSMFAKNVRVDCNAYGDVDVFRIGRHRCTRIRQIMLPRLIVCNVGFSHLLDLHLSLMAGLFFSRLKASPWYEWVPSHQNPSDPLSRDGWQDATAISNIRSGVYAPLHIEPPWHLLSPTLESLSEVITALE